MATLRGLGAIPRLAFIELLGTRWLEQPGHERWRHNLLCALRKAPAWLNSKHLVPAQLRR